MKGRGPPGRLFGRLCESEDPARGAPGADRMGWGKGRLRFRAGSRELIRLIAEPRRRKRFLLEIAPALLVRVHPDLLGPPLKHGHDRGRLGTEAEDRPGSALDFAAVDSHAKGESGAVGDQIGDPPPEGTRVRVDLFGQAQ